MQSRGKREIRESANIVVCEIDGILVLITKTITSFISKLRCTIDRHLHKAALCRIDSGRKPLQRPGSQWRVSCVLQFRQF